MNATDEHSYQLRTQILPCPVFVCCPRVAPCVHGYMALLQDLEKGTPTLTLAEGLGKSDPLLLDAAPNRQQMSFVYWMSLLYSNIVKKQRK